LAWELKHLGFYEPFFGYYHNLGLHQLLLSQRDLRADNNDSIEYCVAPLYQQAFRWFREKHKLNGETTYLPNIGMYGIIASDMTVKPKDLSKSENLKRGSKVTDNYAQYPTREEAELACLQKLIEIVKTTGEI
jgi:hypothetical protein